MSKKHPNDTEEDSKNSNEKGDMVFENNGDIKDYKIAIQKHFVSLANAQGVRLIGLIAGLFTYLQTVERLGGGKLSSMFSGLAIFEINVSPLVLFLFHKFKLILFASVIFILLLFIFRSILRFGFYSQCSSHVKWIRKKELEYLLEDNKNLKGQDLMVLIEMATVEKVTGDLRSDKEKKYPSLSLYGKFSYDWVVSGKKIRTGYLACSALSLVATIILLLVLW